MIQAYYKYKPASFGALALLVCADSKDRFTQEYIADMLRLLLSHRRLAELPPRVAECIHGKVQPKMTKEQAGSFVDRVILTFKGDG